MSGSEEESSSSYHSEDDNQAQENEIEDEKKEIEDEEEEEPTPENIEFDSPIVTAQFHPTSDKIACGLMDGVVAFYEYGVDLNKELWSMSMHDKPLRDMKFNDAGDRIYSVSSDRSLKVTDVEKQKSFYEVEKAHKSAINAVGCAEHFVFTGDDDGAVKIWDMRKKGPIFEFKENTDYISDFSFNHTKRLLLAPSGDGTLAVFSYRKGRLEALSDNMEDELLTSVIVKNGKKAVVGGQTGCLWIWSWGDWGDVTDRITGHPESVDKILKYDEDSILTGSSDGIIRVVTIHPNKLLGVIGQHDDYPADKLAMSHDRRFLASCPSDSTIKFWGINFLAELDEDDSGDFSDDSDEFDSNDNEDGGEQVEGEENEGNDENEGEVDQDEGEEDDNENNSNDEENESEEEEVQNNTNVKKVKKNNNNTKDEESLSESVNKKKLTGVKRKKEEEEESVEEQQSKKTKKGKLNNDTPLGKFFADL